MKVIIKWFFILLAVGIASLLLVIWYGWAGGSDLAGGVNAHSICKIKINMTQDEVQAILGKPFSVVKERELGLNRIRMNYSKEVHRAKWYPMLWVHLQDGKVLEVYVKRYIYWGADDEGVYLLSGEQPLGCTPNQLEGIFPP